ACEHEHRDDRDHHEQRDLAFLVALVHAARRNASTTASPRARTVLEPGAQVRVRSARPTVHDKSTRTQPPARNSLVSTSTWRWPQVMSWDASARAAVSTAEARASSALRLMDPALAASRAAPSMSSRAAVRRPSPTMK